MHKSEPLPSIAIGTQGYSLYALICLVLTGFMTVVAFRIIYMMVGYVKCLFALSPKVQRKIEKDAHAYRLLKKFSSMNNCDKCHREEW